MTRAEHLAWAKGRALEYADAGELNSATASMLNDLSKFEGIGGWKVDVAACKAALAASFDGPAAVRAWIEGIS